jgi:hypothetical protein
MDVYLISEDGVEVHSAEDLSELLDKPDALIWVDIPLVHRAGGRGALGGIWVP